LSLQSRHARRSASLPYTTLFRSDGLVGYTLRAYRPAGQITPTEAPEEDEDDPFAAAEGDTAAEDVDDAGGRGAPGVPGTGQPWVDRKSTRLNSSHVKISYAVFCL